MGPKNLVCADSTPSYYHNSEPQGSRRGMIGPVASEVPVSKKAREPKRAFRAEWCRGHEMGRVPDEFRRRCARSDGGARRPRPLQLASPSSMVRYDMTSANVLGRVENQAPDKRRVRSWGGGAGPLSPRQCPRAFLGAGLKWSGDACASRKPHLLPLRRLTALGALFGPPLEGMSALATRSGDGDRSSCGRPDVRLRRQGSQADGCQGNCSRITP